MTYKTFCKEPHILGFDDVEKERVEWSEEDEAEFQMRGCILGGQCFW
jgi:hypothetical protein